MSLYEKTKIIKTEMSFAVPSITSRKIIKQDASATEDIKRGNIVTYSTGEEIKIFSDAKTEVPYGILLDDVSLSRLKSRDTDVRVMVKGDLEQSKLVLASGVTLDTVITLSGYRLKDNLRNNGILIVEEE